MVAHSLEINHLHICSLLNCDLFLLYHHQRKKKKKYQSVNQKLETSFKQVRLKFN